MNKHRRAKIVVLRSFMIALGLLIGVLVSAQWRSIPARVTNPVASYTSLKETKEELYKEQSQLKEEIKDLQHQIEKVQSESEDVSLSKEELSNLNYKKAQAGLTRLNGPGVIITYDDSTSSTLTEESIIHAADLRDTVNLLWSTGAEAIIINNQRVVISTAIDCIVNTILINNTKISNPFRIEAIGDQEMMYQELLNSPRLTNLRERNKLIGLVFDIQKNNDITVPVYDGSFEVPVGGDNNV